MDIDLLKNCKKSIGTKQTLKAIQKGSAIEVLIAKDAESHVVAPLYDLCAENRVAVKEVESMAALGKACGIDVGTASVAILK
ncbi:ribosomal L7Ae/L30e/S12e/Gadd45 family protein [Dehalobacterium formicoaceticum]|uniref:Ribosomal L7Ae/L30e/S12e/Gadd45 family protein n=1 Tax=Dehalobacterium formicoaceticum TaxID=51515 RepID=A0ABT1XZB1_9FIRM|nr:ribosomal L7Ae/L30e/S12e/Gadd45 family protein [Dehalobacterium formicoaceticum]MCR6543948.1 ribosomal L7Ae/L30e/S12e/Gadd45 family protein [Dehalobacterium formicoaceticum]